MIKYWKKVPYLPIKNSAVMYKFLKRPLSTVALFLVAGFILTTACERPEDEIGLKLQPGDDILQANQVDTFTVSAFSEIDDSVRTDKLNPAWIGAYRDPVFGLVKAGHVTELRLTSTNPNFLGDSSTVSDIQVDSLVLVLSYQNPGKADDTTATSVYGNGLGMQYFKVFEITDSLSVDSPYYELTPVNYINEDLVKQGYNYQTPRPNKNVVVGADTLPPQMRIRLNEDLALRFLEASAAGDFNGLTFLEMFKGLYITVDESMSNPNSSGILSFDTYTGASRMTMYYKDTRTGDDSLVYNFAIRSSTGKFNRFEHDYTNAQMNLVQQLNGDYESAKQDLFLQSGAGLKIRVDFPFIENLKDSTNIAINQAKLILPVRPDNLGQYPPPQVLFLFGRNEDGVLYQLKDDAPSQSGNYDPDSHTYTFYISRYLQQILLGTRENHGLEIVASAAGRTVSRVVLNGSQYPNPSNPSNNLKLAITFTKF